MNKGVVLGILMLVMLAVPVSAQLEGFVETPSQEVQCCIVMQSQDPGLIQETCGDLVLDDTECEIILSEWSESQRQVLEDTSPLFAAIVFLIVGAIVLLVILMVAVYIYSSFAFMYIGRRANAQYPELAWIPLVGKPLLSSMIAKMHWWPIVLIAANVVSPFLSFTRSILMLIILGTIVFGASIVFTVYFYIWRWKMFEAVGRPGWWVLFDIIPIVGDIVYLVLLGVAAWGKLPQEMQAAEIRQRYKSRDSLTVKSRGGKKRGKKR